MSSLIKQLYDNLGALSSPFLKPGSGGYVMNTRATASSPSTAALNADRMTIAPWVPGANFTASAISINVTAAVASSNAKIVCFASGTDGKPSDLLWESGNLDTSTTGEKIYSASQTFSRNTQYWLGVRNSGAITISVWPLTAIAPINGRTTFSTSAAASLVQTLAYATATPSTWTWAAADISVNLPATIGMKV